MPARLITIPVSHYCEKARWALDLAGLPYVEDGWPPALHRLPLRRLGATTAPVLVCEDGGVLRDSTAIVRHADAHAGLGLFGRDAARREEVEALVARFDTTIGPAARLLAYAGLLDHPGAFLRTAGAGLAPPRARMLRLARPLVATTIRRFFGIDAAAVRRARATVDSELAFAEGLRERSSFFGAEGLSAVELTFCALTAPLLHPPGYGAPVPSLEEMPAAHRAEIARWRATPAGSIALELYARHRHSRTP